MNYDPSQPRSQQSKIGLSVILRSYGHGVGVTRGECRERAAVSARGNGGRHGFSTTATPASASLTAAPQQGPGEEGERKGSRGVGQRGAKDTEEKKKNKGKPNFDGGTNIVRCMYGKGSLIITTWSGVLLPIVSFSYI